jgi:hypothetical protein
MQLCSTRGKKIRIVPAVTSVVRSIWKKKVDDLSKEDVIDLREFPSLMNLVGSICSQFHGRFSGIKVIDDPEFDPTSEKIVRLPPKKRAAQEIDIHTGSTIANLPVNIRSTKKIKTLQAFMDEPTGLKTIYNAAATVARLFLSRNHLMKQEPLGLMVLLSKKYTPSHFVHIPALISSFYKSFYCNPSLHPNTYCAFFLGWFPVWLVITCTNVIVYILPAESIEGFYDKETQTFDSVQIVEHHPDFDICDVFEYDIYGAELLPTIFGRIAIIMYMLHGNDIAVELEENQVANFQCHTYEIMKSMMAQTCKQLELYSDITFRPLTAICNVGKKLPDHLSCSDVKLKFEFLTRELSTSCTIGPLPGLLPGPCA